MSTKLKTIRLKSDLVQKIQKMADSENRNFNNMVETLLMKAIEENKITITPLFCQGVSPDVSLPVYAPYKAKECVFTSCPSPYQCQAIGGCNSINTSSNDQ